MKKSGIINRAMYAAKQGRKGYQFGGPPTVPENLEIQTDPQQDELTNPYMGSNYQPAAIDKAIQKVAQTSMPVVQTARELLSQNRPILTPKRIASSFVPPEQQGAVSPSMEGVMEGATAVGRGFGPAMQATGKYIMNTGPRQFASDIGTVAGHMAQAARENPAEFIGGMLPGIGNMYSLRDIDELKGKIATARAAGDEETALKLEKFAPLAAVGAAAPFGAGAVVGAVTKAAERAAMKSIPRELSPLGLYSYGMEAASLLPQAKGTPEQMAAMLQRQGVKPVEMEGFVESFAGKPSITREEASQFFKGRMPAVEEKILGGNSQLLENLRLQNEELKNKFNSLEDGDPNRTVLMEQMKDIFDKMYELKNASAATRYGDYTLPNGQNYREILLKLPSSWQPKIEEKYGRYGFTGPDGQYRDYWSLSDAEQAARSFYRDSGSFKSAHWSDPDVLAHIRVGDRISPNGEKILHVEEIQSDWAQKAQKLRTDEIKRVAAEQQITKEEAAKLVSQDYAFSGAKERLLKMEDEVNAAEDALQNYRRDPNQDRKLVENYEKAMEDYNAFFQNTAMNDEKVRAELIRRHVANTGTPPTEETIQFFLDAFKNDRKPLAEGFFPEEFKLVEQARRDAIDKLNEFRINDPVKQQLEREADDARARLAKFQETYQILPKNQYVSNTGAWTDLALKRILKEAAEGGYSRVVFTPGAEQVKRYDLRKQVKQIIAEQRDDGIALNVYDHRDNKILQPRGLTIDQVADHVGKEAAQKIQDQFEASLKSGANLPRADLRGLDLQVGGEGMIGYYDKIVPTQLAKLTKKLDPDAKIEPHPIYGLADDISGQSLTITPKLREAILGGMPYYADGGAVKRAYSIGFTSKHSPVVGRALMLTSKKA
jgi:hypothetical protein